MYGHAEEVERYQEEIAQLKTDLGLSEIDARQQRELLASCEIALGEREKETIDLQARLDKVEKGFRELMNDAIVNRIGIPALLLLGKEYYFDKAGLEWDQHSAPQINPDNS